MNEEEEQRRDERLRALIDSLDEDDRVSLFGIITTKGYKELRTMFDNLAHMVRLLVRIVITGMLVLLGVVVYAFYTDFSARKEIVKSTRQGCERDKKDRKANAGGWRIAELARRADGEIIIANKYDRIADGMEMRADIKCNERYPEASLLP